MRKRRTRIRHLRRCAAGRPRRPWPGALRQLRSLSPLSGPLRRGSPGGMPHPASLLPPLPRDAPGTCMGAGCPLRSGKRRALGAAARPGQLGAAAGAAEMQCLQSGTTVRVVQWAAANEYARYSDTLAVAPTGRYRNYCSSSFFIGLLCSCRDFVVVPGCQSCILVMMANST
jgi:hypothetical protein